MIKRATEEPTMNVFEANQKLNLFMEKVFARLGLRDLIRCRAVSRQFKVYADQALATLDELIVQSGYGTKPKHWYLTDRRIDWENSIRSNAFASIKSSLLRLDQLKFLYLNLNSGFDHKILNGFKQLEHLEIVAYSSGGTQKKTLTLPNLRVLRFGDHHDFFVLKTPKLEVLACNRFDAIRVEYPTRIKRLECYYPGETCSLATFKNLEAFKCQTMPSDLSGSFWAGLKELDLCAELRYMSKLEYEKLMSSLVNLIGRRAGQREELKLYLNDVQLTDADQLIDYQVMRSAPDQFWFKNYQRLRHDSYPAVTNVHFNRLMNLTVELSTDFFRRFPRIGKLTATGSIDREDIKWFLKNANALRDLSLTGTSLDDEFMDILPNINNRLTHLKVTEVSSLITRFEFILRFEQLVRFETDGQISSLELPANAFDKLKSLQCFDFRSGFDRIQIERFSPYNPMYTLSFSLIGYNWTEKFSLQKLSCTELTTLHDQRRAALKKRATIKRARLE